MAEIIKYEPADPVVPNRVTQRIVSYPNAADYVGAANTLVWASPPIATNPLTEPWPEGVSPRYAKVVGGVVVEMTQAEKDAWDAATHAANLAAALAEARAAAAKTDATYTPEDMRYRALLLVLAEEFGTTAKALDDRIKAKINAGTADLPTGR